MGCCNSFPSCALLPLSLSVLNLLLPLSKSLFVCVQSICVSPLFTLSLVMSPRPAISPIEKPHRTLPLFCPPYLSPAFPTTFFVSLSLSLYHVLVCVYMFVCTFSSLSLIPRVFPFLAFAPSTHISLCLSNFISYLRSPRTRSSPRRFTCVHSAVDSQLSERAPPKKGTAVEQRQGRACLFVPNEHVNV